MIHIFRYTPEQAHKTSGRTLACSSVIYDDDHDNPVMTTMLMVMMMMMMTMMMMPSSIMTITIEHCQLHNSQGKYHHRCLVPLSLQVRCCSWCHGSRLQTMSPQAMGGHTLSRIHGACGAIALNEESTNFAGSFTVAPLEAFSWAPCSRSRLA